MGRSCDGADSRALAIYVINPYLGVFNQLLRLNPSLIKGHGEVNLKLALKCQEYQGWTVEGEETHRVITELLTELSDRFDI